MALRNRVPYYRRIKMHMKVDKDLPSLELKHAINPTALAPS